ncbi:MAG: agmatinase [Candidatus Micrarchaeota archaeon]|nr:MAG: agmatinase [Candidatus Micrarchaeota archaeon]
MKVLNSLPPYNMFGLYEQDYSKARFVILPVPYDSTTSYRSGTRDGPRSIINASRFMELFDEELEMSIDDTLVFTLDELEFNADSPRATIDRIVKEVSIIVEDKKIPVLIGGEHTIALGNVEALLKLYKDFTIIHIDAHSDSRDTFMGSKYSHATVARRFRDLTRAISIGVRSVDADSYKLFKDSILLMKDIRGIDDIYSFIEKNTTDKVYLSLDFDAMDPSEMPNVGTPEPGGFRYNDIIEILRFINQRRDVIGADFCELLPYNEVYSYTAAKIIYKFILYKYKFNLMK